MSNFENLRISLIFHDHGSNFDLFRSKNVLRSKYRLYTGNLPARYQTRGYKKYIVYFVDNI